MKQRLKRSWLRPKIYVSYWGGMTITSVYPGNGVIPAPELRPALEPPTEPEPIPSRLRRLWWDLQYNTIDRFYWWYCERYGEHIQI